MWLFGLLRPSSCDPTIVPLYRHRLTPTMCFWHLDRLRIPMLLLLRLLLMLLLLLSTSVLLVRGKGLCIHGCLSSWRLVVHGVLQSKVLVTRRLSSRRERLPHARQ